MKRIIAAVAVTVFTAGIALAGDTVTFTAKNGNVTFNHKKHGESGDCKICHGDGTPGKLTLGKETFDKGICLFLQKSLVLGELIMPP